MHCTIRNKTGSKTPYAFVTHSKIKQMERLCYIAASSSNQMIMHIPAIINTYFH
jgi:hypothetical protein